MATIDELKLEAAEVAATLIEDGMLVGLGSGSTATLAVSAIGRRVSQGLRIKAVATSETTAELARQIGIPLFTLGELEQLDVTIDGADEVERNSLDLIKGRGGALLREKLVASASDRLVIAVDESKLVDNLYSGGKPIPVEVEQFGWRSTARRLSDLGASWRLRPAAEGRPFVTDGGHFILDCVFAQFDSAELQRRLDGSVGVVEHGLFLGMACEVIVGTGTAGTASAVRMHRSLHAAGTFHPHSCRPR